MPPIWHIIMIIFRSVFTIGNAYRKCMMWFKSHLRHTLFAFRVIQNNHALIYTWICFYFHSYFWVVTVVVVVVFAVCVHIVVISIQKMLLDLNTNSSFDWTQNWASSTTVCLKHSMLYTVTKHVDALWCKDFARIQIVPHSKHLYLGFKVDAFYRLTSNLIKHYLKLCTLRFERNRQFSHPKLSIGRFQWLAHWFSAIWVFNEWASVLFWNVLHAKLVRSGNK